MSLRSMLYSPTIKPASYIVGKHIPRDKPVAVTSVFSLHALSVKAPMTTHALLLKGLGTGAGVGKDSTTTAARAAARQTRTLSISVELQDRLKEFKVPVRYTAQ